MRAVLVGVLALLAIASPSWAVTVTVKHIKTDCTGDSDCYTSFTAWQTARVSNLVTGDKEEIAECYTGAYTETFTTSASWVTDATHRVILRAAAGQGHGGSFSAGCRITDAGTSDGAIRNNGTNYFEVHGLVIIMAAGKAGIIQIADSAVPGSKIVFEGNLIDGGGTNIGKGIYSAFAGMFYVANNIIIGTKGASSGYAIGMNKAGSTMYAYNNTMVTNRIGIAALAGTVNATNNLCQDPSASGCYVTVSGGATNLSSDATSPQTALRSKTVTFATGTKNYHLDPTDTSAKDAGTDLSADLAYPFSTDMEGQTRTAPWDIGADEYVFVSATAARRRLIQ